MIQGNSAPSMFLFISKYFQNLNFKYVLACTLLKCKKKNRWGGGVRDSIDHPKIDASMQRLEHHKNHQRLSHAMLHIGRIYCIFLSETFFLAIVKIICKY